MPEDSFNLEVRMIIKLNAMPTIWTSYTLWDVSAWKSQSLLNTHNIGDNVDSNVPQDEGEETYKRRRTVK